MLNLWNSGYFSAFMSDIKPIFLKYWSCRTNIFKLKLILFCNICISLEIFAILYKQFSYIEIHIWIRCWNSEYFHHEANISAIFLLYWKCFQFKDNIYVILDSFVNIFNLKPILNQWCWCISYIHSERILI